MSDVTVERVEHVAVVELHRPPHNYFDQQLIAEVADAMEALDADNGCRAIVLAAEGGGRSAQAPTSAAAHRASMAALCTTRPFACSRS